MPFGDYILGLVVFAVMAGCSAAASYLVLRRRLAHLTGSAAVTAYGLILAAVVLAVHVVPLTLGVLSRATVVAGALVALAVATRLTAGSPTPEVVSAQAPDAPRISWITAIAALAAVATYVITFTVHASTEALSSTDALNFHLPHSAHWIQTGSLWHIDNIAPKWAFGHYPNNGDMFQLATILPWHNDALVRFVGTPFLGLAGLGVYAAAREVGAQRPASATFAVLAISLPTSLTVALDFGVTDTQMLAAFAAGVLFLLRYARTRERSDLVLAGLGLGIALGTKWYGVSTVPVVLLVWLVARALARHQRKEIARDTLLVSGVIAAAGGIWLVRNLVLSGNPVFPVKIAPLGVTIFDAPPDPVREEFGFALTHYLLDTDVWTTLRPLLERSFGFGAILLILSAVAVLLLALRPGRRDPRVAAVAAAALLCLAVYAATPYSAMGPEGRPILAAAAARYGMPALFLCAIAAAWLARRLGRAGPVLELAGLVLIADAISRYADFSGVGRFSLDWPLALATGVLVAAILVGAGHLYRREDRGRWAGRRGVVANVAFACAVLVVAGGHLQQRRFNEKRYVGVDLAFDWFHANAAAGSRVGLAGVHGSGGYPAAWIAFGPRLENQVEYVGRLVEDRMEVHETEDGFRDALRRGRYDVVFVSLGDRRPGGPREVAWTEAEGYTEKARTGRVAVFGRD